MSLNDTILNNMIFSTFIKNENQVLSFIFVTCFYIFNIIHSNYNILNIFKNFTNTENKIVFIASDKESSNRFRAVMHFIIEKSNVIEIRELERFKNNWVDDKIAYYKVNQRNKFLITDNIYGLVIFKEKETKQNAIVTSEEFQHLEISSPNLNVRQIKDFVERCNVDYEKYLKDQILKHQLYVDISWDIKEKDIIVKSNKWKSSATFENKFFTDKALVINKLDFFLENKHIYNKRGIPHTLGFLLFGDPGTGKSSFIKAVANKTNYHIINIKLSKNFDFQHLHKILFNESITHNLMIPLNKRIIIFEDIDCMTDIIKNRFNKEDEDECNKQKKEDNIKKEDDYSFAKKIIAQLEETENNNLSFLLNILDGVQEAEDRIIIMTTNKPEELDNALIRPGRIDIKIHFKKATIKDIRDILCNFWENDIDICNIEEIFNEKLTHAEIINICKESKDLEETLINLKSYF
jgi:SpoVK/Ycf46/Vps4 family AAA+-type ATPase